MEMEQHRQRLELCFTEYEELQNLHLFVMKNEPMPDLVRMTEDRDKAFDELKQNLNTFVQNAGSNGGINSLPVLAEYEVRLTSIMDVSEELSKAILEYRKDLKTNLSKMQQGKAALRGYKTVNMN
jgi:septation ring formation regulator EzrA